MTDKPETIFRRMAKLDSEHREKVRLLTKDIQDKYHKDLQALRNECGIAGHIQGRYHDNGLGTEWFYCSRCGGQIPETVKRYWELADASDAGK